MRFLKENTMAIVIDIQERLFPHISNKNSLENNVLTLIKSLELLKVPIMVSEQYRKGLGTTIPSIKELLNTELLADKISFSCYDDDGMKSYIKSQNKTNIILFGIESHVCVLQTALDLIDDKYTVIVIENCCSSRSELDHHIAMRRIEKEGAFISSYESIALELCRFAGNDTFKSISKLIK